MKQCSKCQEMKPIECFRKRIRHNREGIYSICKECEHKYHKAHPVKRTEKHRSYDRKYGKNLNAKMGDAYIRKLIWHDSNGQIKAKDVTPEMIKERRSLLIDKRDNKRERIGDYYAGDSCKVYFRKCKRCGEEFTTRYESAVFCHDYRCTLDGYAEYQRKIYKPKVKTKRICQICGNEFKTAKHNEKTCSDKCSKRLAHRDRNHKQRAERFGVAYEYINEFKVFKRDMWHCQICGKSTPEKNRGTLKRNAPELDHRVAMSKGGGHIYSNVQCACRRCNGLKSNTRETGQFPLFEVITSAYQATQNRPALSGS